VIAIWVWFYSFIIKKIVGCVFLSEIYVFKFGLHYRYGTVVHDLFIYLNNFY